MSNLLMLSLFLLLSCVDEDVKTPPVVGRYISNIQVDDPIDNARVWELCKALGNKESRLHLLASSNTAYTFSYAQKGCSETALPVAQDIVVTIKGSYPVFTFQPTTNGEYFGPNEVETDNVGVMKEICNYGATLGSPVGQGSTGSIHWTTKATSENCKAQTGTICVYLQRGTAANGQRDLLHTEEWIKFQMTGPQEGFFLERKIKSNIGCKSKETFEIHARLK